MIRVVFENEFLYVYGPATNRQWLLEFQGDSVVRQRGLLFECLDQDHAYAVSRELLISFLGISKTIGDMQLLDRAMFVWRTASTRDEAAVAVGQSFGPVCSMGVPCVTPCPLLAVGRCCKGVAHSPDSADNR